MAGTTRQQMIEGAAKLLARRGLQGTSFSEVIEATGAPRGSIYHHFPGGKHELVGEAVTLIADRVVGLLALLERPAGPAEVVDAFVAGFRQLLVGSRFRSGCGIAAVTVGAGAEAEDLLPAAARAFGSWREALAAALRRSGMDDGAAEALAVLTIAGVEGALVLGRATRGTDEFDVVARHLHDVAAASVPPGRSGARRRR